MTVERRAIASVSQWLEWRREFLCASEIGAAVGIDPYRSALSLYAEKAGLIGGAQETPIMRRGRNFQGAARAYLAEDNPTWRIIDPHVFLFDRDNRLGATPDALIEIPGVEGIVNCQIKTVAKPEFERWHGILPGSYALQVACENLMLDSAYGILCALVVDTYSAAIETFTIERHPGAEQKIVDLAREFWSNVEARKFPAPDFRRDQDTIAEMYARPVEGPPLDLTLDNRIPEVLTERARLKAEIEADVAKVAALDAEIKMRLGEAERAVLPGWKISWKEVHRKEHVVPASTFRRLTVTETRNDAA